MRYQYLILKKNVCVKLLSRNFGKYNAPSSKNIRQQFLDHFILKNDHTFIRSSPVVPFCDPSIAFVNAGMNQFKNVFLGQANVDCKRAANSQKCIRIGGKHNDISIVGSDSYHHTFFEMLGNWSFGDYFKQEAIEMAWHLLKDVYKINPDRLYVTYFGGDESLNLAADLECREIWRNLGVSADRILPFGMKDNFWEMGNAGPCGPCTEIHVDHSDQYKNVERRRFVNADQPDLTELWNIVFIQYNRSLNGQIFNLPQTHVDTGMGMERLVAHLQNKNSNYDTDLFSPIIQHIHKVSGKNAYQGSFDKNSSTYELDTAYRIVADHSRMITACLADGMFPSHSAKLRKILRKTFAFSERVFESKGLLNDIVPVVVDILGETYPEMQRRMKDIDQIITHEEENYLKLLSNLSVEAKSILKENHNLEELDLLDYPGFAHGYKEILKHKCDNPESNTLPAALLYKLNNTFGFDVEIMSKIAQLEKLELDLTGYENHCNSAKDELKWDIAVKLQQSSSENNILKASTTPETKNEYKYNYAYNSSKNMYDIPPLKTRLRNIVIDEKLVDSTDGRLCHIITEKSNFYYESGGQESDTGKIQLAADNSVHFDVKSVSHQYGYVIHSGYCIKGSLKVGDDVILSVDADRRSKNIVHHTATHLLNAITRRIIDVPVCQKMSAVTHDGLKLELAVVGKKLNREHVQSIEDSVRSAIKAGAPISTKLCNSNDRNLDFDKITMIPGEIYPEKGMRVVSVGGENMISSELCCGTHAGSTSELNDFCITNLKMAGSHCYAFHAVAGDAAVQAHLRGRQISDDVINIKSDLDQEQHNLENIDARVHRLKNLLQSGFESNINISYCTKHKCLDILNELNKKIKDHSKETLLEFMKTEIKTLLEQSPVGSHRFIVHFLESSSLLEEIDLSKATRLCKNRPILVICLIKGKVKARCCVPASFVTPNFNATKWMASVASVFDAKFSSSNEQNADEVCSMKYKKVSQLVFENKLDEAILAASEYAVKNM